MVEVELNKIKIDENKSEQVIILKEKRGSRYLPLIIGIAEVNAIKLEISGFRPPRPMTHDLVLNVVKGLNAKIKRVVIDRLVRGTFHAKIILSNGKAKETFIDSRPSDSIAVAMRARVPIFVEDSVLKEAAIDHI